MLSEAVGANQPAYSASDANLNNRPSLTFTAGKQLFSTLPPADWSFLSDGSTGATTYTVYYHAAVSTYAFFLSTKLTTGLQVGFANNVYDFAANSIIYNGVAAVQAIANGVYTAGKRWNASRSNLSANPATQARSSASSSWVTSGTIAASGAAPEGTLNIRPNIGTVAFAEKLIFNTEISDASHDLIAAYFVDRYGAF